MNNDTAVFQVDNSKWPKEGYPLPEVFVRFPFNFDFTERDFEYLRTEHANTGLGFKWLYISDEQIFIYRGRRCFYQIKIHPGKLTHTAIYYIYGDIDRSFGYGSKPKDLLLDILHRWTNNADTTIIKTVRSVVYGHAIADALGVPVEFSSRQELQAHPVEDMMGYGTHPVPAGAWSDDTSMALATLDSLAAGIDYNDIMSKFCAWKAKAAYTATGKVFDMGISTHTALSRFQQGIPALKCGCFGEKDNGNGSLMRIYPAVLYWYYTHRGQGASEEFDAFIFAVSSLTHAHLRSKLACGIYSNVLLKLLGNRTKDSIFSGLHDAALRYKRNPEYVSELKHFARLFAEEFSTLPEDEIKSSGYVVATLEAAIWCVLNTDSYDKCIRKAVNLGGDTDTVAAVSGALAGCLYGLEGVPANWFDGLLRKDMIDGICADFTNGLLTSANKRRLFDTHGHYVFGIDDGASDIEMSVSMIREAYKQGVRDIICTSHSWGNYQLYPKRLSELTEQLNTEGIPVHLYSGTEIACTRKALDNIVWKLNHGLLHTMGKSSYILLEFYPNVESAEILWCIKQFMEPSLQGYENYKPIVAHVERYRCFQECPSDIRVLKMWGIPLQINAYSLVEEKKDAIRKFARDLLTNKFVTFVGSDAHRITHRPPNVKSGIDYIYKNCDKDYADAICFRNAERLLLQTER